MAARLTPGGALLRTSRLFSLPPPLPPLATNDLAPASRASATATTPYPTHQAIATTPRSRARGDWGLKRPLPSLQTGTPLIRVRQLDAIEQVTDFASASDHVMTLEKVHEMGLAVGRPGSGGANAAMIGLRSDNRSVFEDEVDFTTTTTTGQDGSGAAGEATAAAAVARRWKFKGPWLAGMTDAELTHYLAREVRGRRAEFRSFLKTKLVADLNRAAIQAAMDSGEAPPSKPLTVSDVTDEQVSEYLARLRGDRATLHDHVAEFLDLAPLPPTSILGFTSSTGTGSTKSATSSSSAPKPSHQQSPYARDGPPATHPSAGLTYLRTSAVAENHPLYGPQRSRPPVVARILQPRYTRPGAGSGGSGLAQLGVAGLVADAPFGDMGAGGAAGGNHNPVFRRRGGAAAGQLQGAQARRHEALPGMTMLDLDTPGGAKAVVEPTGLTVASSGRVMLRTVAAASDAQLVKAEWLGLHDLYDAEGGEEPTQSAAPLPTRPARPARPRGDVYGSSKTYGLD